MSRYERGSVSNSLFRAQGVDLLINGFRKSVAAGILTTCALSTMAIMGPAPAFAVGGDCTSKKETSGLNNRGGALCTSLQADSRARPKLIRELGPDYHGDYFTALNVWRYTDWYTCYAGCEGAYEITHV